MIFGYKKTLMHRLVLVLLEMTSLQNIVNSPAQRIQIQEMMISVLLLNVWHLMKPLSHSSLILPRWLVLTALVQALNMLWWPTIFNLMLTTFSQRVLLVTLFSYNCFCLFHGLFTVNKQMRVFVSPAFFSFLVKVSWIESRCAGVLSSH